MKVFACASVLGVSTYKFYLIQVKVCVVCVFLQVFLIFSRLYGMIWHFLLYLSIFSTSCLQVFLVWYLYVLQSVQDESVSV